MSDVINVDYIIDVINYDYKINAIDVINTDC